MQAEKQLPGGWQLMRDGTASCPSIEDWLVQHIPEGGTVGIDPYLHTVSVSFLCTTNVLSAVQAPTPFMPINRLIIGWHKRIKKPVWLWQWLHVTPCLPVSACVSNNLHS